MKDRNISYWPKLGVNYWGITKCANSTVKTHLYELEYQKEFEFTKETKIHSSSLINYITEDEALRNNLKNFTVTRNPYDRFSSIYRYMILSRPKRGAKAGLNKDMSIDGLLSFIENTLDNERDVHLKTQCSFITTNDIIIIDSKRISDDWPFDFLAPSGFKNKSSNQEKIIFTTNQKNRIWKLYKEDFERFGYSKDSN